MDGLFVPTLTYDVSYANPYTRACPGAILQPENTGSFKFNININEISITTLCAIPLGIPDHIGDFHSESFHLDNLQHFLLKNNILMGLLASLFLPY